MLIRDRTESLITRKEFQRPKKGVRKCSLPNPRNLLTPTLLLLMHTLATGVKPSQEICPSDFGQKCSFRRKENCYDGKR